MLLRYCWSGLDGEERARREQQVGLLCLTLGLFLNVVAYTWGRLGTSYPAADFWRGFMVGFGAVMILVSIPLNLRSGLRST